MIIITSDAAKVKKKIKKILKRYFSLIYPEQMAELMVAKKENSEIIKSASSKLKDVNLVGKIKQTKDGFVYIKVDDKVIDGLFTLIDDEGIKKPPYFGKDGIGAHISLISNEEIKDVKIKEVGDEVNFQLGEMFSTKPVGWEEMDRVWFVTMESKEFAALRKKYNLPATYKGLGHKFHCTIAVRRKK